MWRQAREQAERSEASYEPDRQRAHEADQRELHRLRNRVDGHDTAALDASTRRDELLTEQQLRATMPETQLNLENELRTQAIRQQSIDQATPGLHSELAPSPQMDLEYDHRFIEPDIDRGRPSAGL